MNESAGKTVIFFDGDGTLWDFQAVMRRAMTQTIDELCRLAPDARGALSVDAFVEDRDAAARANPEELVHERVRELGFEASLRRLGVPDDGLARHLTEFFLRRRFAEIALYPDVVPCLERLRGAGVGVGLLTNGNTDPARFGLAHLFDAVVFAHAVGASKPSPAIYGAAEVALPGPRHIMIGDDLTDDVTGPQQAGRTGVWLDRSEDADPAGSAPDLTLHDLDSLSAEVIDRTYRRDASLAAPGSATMTGKISSRAPGA